MEAAAPARMEGNAGNQPRKALAIARRNRLEAAETLARTAAALARGKEQHAAIEARLARFDDLDERNATASAEMIKRGLPVRPDDALAVEYQQRGAIREEAELSAGALRILQAEHDATGSALREAETVVGVAAWKVMVAETAELADELCATHKRIWVLGDRIVGIGILFQASIRNLPAAAVPELRVELRQALSALHAVRPYVPAITAERNRQNVAEWRERHRELVG